VISKRRRKTSSLDEKKSHCDKDVTMEMTCTGDPDSATQELKQLHIDRCINFISQSVIVVLKGERNTARNCSGYLFTVDPETGNIILLRQETNESNTRSFTPIVIFFPSILSIFVDEKAPRCDLNISLKNGEDDISQLIGADNQLWGKGGKNKNEDKLLDRRRLVKDFLTKNRLEVREVMVVADHCENSTTGDECKKWRLEVMGGIVRINEPFDSSSCDSTNPIVLSKIQHLLDSLPT